jgi:peptide/nickel transport system ATP-binding protein
VTELAGQLSNGTGTVGTALLEVRDLNIYFRTGDTEVQAVRDLSFSIGAGETLGMVGESGSGKSVSALSILRLLKSPPARIEGQILLDGVDLLTLSEQEIQQVRGRDVAMIFQEPMTALDPLFPIGYQIAQTLRAHQKISKAAAKEAAIETLDRVGIPLPARRYKEYPHQLSGGMRQRVMIAMAVVCKPRLLIADEPTTAVDVTIQAQILNLLKELNTESQMAILMITHDLGVVAETCQRAITMYAGEAVEQATVDGLLETPLHPYTSALLQAVPRVETRGAVLKSIPGRVPLLHEMPVGCRFEARCTHAASACSDHQALHQIGDRAVRCVRHDELSLPGAVR